MELHHSVRKSNLLRIDIYDPFPEPFTSSWRWRQQGPSKHWYPTTCDTAS